MFPGPLFLSLTSVCTGSPPAFLVGQGGTRVLSGVGPALITVLEPSFLCPSSCPASVVTTVLCMHWFPSAFLVGWDGAGLDWDAGTTAHPSPTKSQTGVCGGGGSGALEPSTPSGSPPDQIALIRTKENFMVLTQP